MILHLHEIQHRDAQMTLEDLWVNYYTIGHFIRCTTKDSVGKSWIYLRDGYEWRTILVSETPEEIEELVTKEVRKWQTAINAGSESIPTMTSSRQPE